MKPRDQVSWENDKLGEPPVPFLCVRTGAFGFERNHQNRVFNCFN